MNIRYTNSNNLIKSQKSLFIFFIMNVIFLIFFCLFYNIIYSLSIKIHIFLHCYINSNLFIKANIFFYKYINKEYISYIMLIIIYNYFNTYKSFMLYIIILISKMFTSFLQLISIIYPLYYDEKINYFYLEKYTFSFPSDYLLYSPIYFYIVFKILTRKMPNRKLNIKILIFSIYCLYITLLCINEFILCFISLNEIIFSFYFSFSIYYFLYKILKINFSDNNQFYMITRIRIEKIIMISIYLFSSEIILYYITYKDENIIFEKLKLQKKITNIPKDDTLMFSKNSFIKSIPFYSIFFLFLGFNYELEYICCDKYNNWAQFNFENENSSNESSFSSNSSNTSLIERISITKGAQWNHTDYKISIIRLICLFYIICAIFFPGYLLNWKNPFFCVLLVKEFIPWCIISFGGSYGFKEVFSTLRLINSTLENILRESVN